MFSIASAVVAFDGWPGIEAPRPVEALVVNETTAPPLEATGPERVAAEATAAAAPAVSSTPVTEPSALGGTPASDILAVDRVQVGERAPRDTTGATPPAAVGTPPETPERGLLDLPQLNVPEPVPTVTNATADATTEATSSLGGGVATTAGVLAEAVSPLSPELGQTLAGAGGLLAGAVAGTGELLADLLRGAGR